MPAVAIDAADPAARAAYHRDGVVCLRGVLASDWLARTAAGLTRNLAHPGTFFRDHTPPGSPGRYLFEFWSWPEVPEFEALIRHGPLAALAGALMDASAIAMVMDNWFLREAGARIGAPWHHDEPYFDFEGRLCIAWFPLEVVSAREGLSFVAGSHRWGKLFAAEQFSENLAFDAKTPNYEVLPDFDSGDQGHEFLSWDMAPGDVLFFDFRTLHHATAGGAPLSRTVRRMTLRFGAEDTMFKPRGAWTEEISAHLIAQGQRPNAVLDNPLTPWVWKSSQ